MGRVQWMLRLAACVLTSLSGELCLAQDCEPGWAQGMYYSEFSGGASAAITYDDGSGPALYLGGVPDGGLGEAPILTPVKWTGSTFVQVGPGLNGTVYAFAKFDPDGTGPRPEGLIIGGTFTGIVGQSEPALSGLALWDGTSFTPLGVLSATNSAPFVRAMAVHNDGHGSKLYVAGNFSSVGGVQASNIACWDGVSWSALGAGIGFNVISLVSHADANGTVLYAGGAFTSAGGSNIAGVAKWDGQSWSSLAQGLVSSPGAPGSVTSLASIDSPSTGGRALVVSGSFQISGVAGFRDVALWKDGGWQAFGSLPHYSSSAGSFTGVLDVDGEQQLYLYIGSTLYRWSGTEWIALMSTPRAWITGVDTTGGRSKFVMMRGFALDLGLFDGSEWAPLMGWGKGVLGTVSGLAVGDLGFGQRVFAIGTGFGGFVRGGDSEVSRLAMWDGQDWLPLGAPHSQNSRMTTLAVFDDGHGPKVFVGGLGGVIGSTYFSGCAMWDGSTWSPAGQQPTSLPSVGITRLKVIDLDGDGPEGQSLVALGRFSSELGLSGVARWNGSQWVQFGNAVALSVLHATDIAVIDADGPGGNPAKIYMSGAFGSGGLSGVARLDGQTWISERLPNQLLARTGADSLAVFDDGSGVALYVGGDFGSWPHYAVVRLKGGVWSEVGSMRWFSGQLQPESPTVSDLRVFDNGSGPALYASGELSIENERCTLAKWDGSSWQSVATSDLGSIRRPLEAFTYQGRPSLVTGGHYQWLSVGPGSPAIRSQGIAVYKGCTPACTADFNRDGDTGTDADIEAFFACLAGNCCARCLTSDFNGDGDFGTDGDIESFFRVLAGGPC